jgi:Baseplate J-like protein
MPTIPYTNKDYASLLSALQDIARQQLPEWTDQSPNDLGVMLLELFCAMGDSLFYNQDRIAGESFLATAVERRSVVQHLRLIGYELRPPVPASADLALLFASAATGTVTIPSLAAFKTTAAATGTPLTFQYIQATPIVIDRAALPFAIVDARGALEVLQPGRPLPSPLAAGSTGYRAYQTLPVVQVDANVSNEIVASSDGSAGQRYPLRQSPVVEDTLVVRVDEGGGPVTWNRVPSLLASQPADASYAVRVDENGVVWIEFGGNPYGRAPLRGLNNITATYARGGGAKGNVPALAISKPVTAIDQLKLVVNQAPATGGADAEDTADAARRGPQRFRSGDRAVTSSDYVALAQVFGIAKALAQPSGWNTVKLVVAPVGGGRPSATLLQDLQTYLAPRRMLNAIVDIVGPTYIPLYIDAVVFVPSQYAANLVQQRVQQTVADLLGFDRVEFNQTLYISKLYEVIQEIEGVAGVNITTFACGQIYVPGSLPKSGQLIFGATDASELPIWQGFDGKTSNLTMQPGAS